LPNWFKKNQFFSIFSAIFSTIFKPFFLVFTPNIQASQQQPRGLCQRGQVPSCIGKIEQTMKKVQELDPDYW
jgi:hypothetical protein